MYSHNLKLKLSEYTAKVSSLSLLRENTYYQFSVDPFRHFLYSILPSTTSLNS